MATEPWSGSRDACVARDGWDDRTANGAVVPAGQATHALRVLRMLPLSVQHTEHDHQRGATASLSQSPDRHKRTNVAVQRCAWSIVTIPSSQSRSSPVQL